MYLTEYPGERTRLFSTLSNPSKLERAETRTYLTEYPGERAHLFSTLSNPSPSNVLPAEVATTAVILYVMPVVPADSRN